MMTDLMAVEMMHYNRWANLRVLDTCLGLTVEQLDGSAAGCYGTIYDTIVHIVRAEASYTRRLTGTRPEPEFLWDDKPPMVAIRPYAEVVSSALIGAAEHVGLEDSFPVEWDGEIIPYKAVGLMIQVVNHGIEHRAHIATILTQLGVTPPEIDGWSYMGEHPERMRA